MFLIALLAHSTTLFTVDQVGKSCLCGIEHTITVHGCLVVRVDRLSHCSFYVSKKKVGCGFHLLLHTSLVPARDCKTI